MILPTCGASAVVFHTTSFAWRAAWARRTSHQGAVVARTAAVLPACCKMSRRVSMVYLPSLALPERSPSRHRLALRIPPIDLHHLLVRLLDRLLGLPAIHQHPLDHVAKDVGGQHLACSGIRGTRVRELTTGLEHGTPVLVHWPLPEVRVVHA